MVTLLQSHRRAAPTAATSTISGDPEGSLKTIYREGMGKIAYF
jgi:hypothetical protein